MNECFQNSIFPDSIKKRFASATASTRPIYKIKFLPEHYPKAAPEYDRTERDFIIGGTDFPSSLPTGRATKGYIAYDVVGRRMTYLKDTWHAFDTQ